MLNRIEKALELMHQNVSVDNIRGFIAVAFKFCADNSNGIIFIEVYSIKDGSDNRFQVENWRVKLDAK